MEITKPVDLCVGLGRLNHLALGWARKPLVRCNIKGHFLRKKKWNYWAVYNKDYVFSATIANLDYVGMCFWYFIDIKNQKLYENSLSVPFGVGCKMPESPEESVNFASKNLKIQMIKKGQMTELLLEDLHSSINARFEIFHHDFESLNVVVPWDWNRFQFTSKHFSLSARGEVTLNGKNILFNESDTFATFDFGRGVWKYKTSWNWASSAARLEDGTLVGINLGGKWTDKTGVNENALLVNGKLTKLESDVVFVYDSEDLMKPWSIYSTSSDEVHLEFTPVFVRNSKINLLFFSSKVHQLFGFFKGFVRDENRKVFVLTDSFGWAEQHEARW